MTIRRFRALAFTALIAPLALGLASCGKSSDAKGEPASAVIAKVAPPAGKIWADIVAKTPEGSVRMGNPNAALKLVEYGSLTCGACGQFSDQSAVPLRDNFVASGRVSYEFRNLLRDPIDLTVSTLVRCGTPESYYPLLEQAFKNQSTMLETAQKAGEAGFNAAIAQPEGKRGIALAELAGLTDFFAARGISKDQANACLANSSEAQAFAKRSEEQSAQYKIQGTPTFLINGEVIGSMRWDELKAKLETLGAR